MVCSLRQCRWFLRIKPHLKSIVFMSEYLPEKINANTHLMPLYHKFIAILGTNPGGYITFLPAEKDIIAVKMHRDN